MKKMEPQALENLFTERPEVKATPYACSVCNDTGFVLVDARAKRCDCRVKTSAAFRLNSAAIPKEYQHCTIENYKPESASQKTGNLAARKYITEYQRDGGGIIFYGDGTGRGKTHLAVGTLKKLIEKFGVTGLFVDFLQFIKLIQASYGDDDETTEAKLFRKILSVDVLLIDDLGQKDNKEFRENVFFNIVNHRYTEQKSLILTTNMGFEHIEKAKSYLLCDLCGTACSLERHFRDKRIFSRLAAICPRGRRIHVTGGKDWRNKE